MCEIMDQIRADGIQIGFQQGFQQGRQEQSRDIAESMLKGGLAIELVAEHCKMSLEDVMKLKEEIEN